MTNIVNPFAADRPYLGDIDQTQGVGSTGAAAAKALADAAPADQVPDAKPAAESAETPALSLPNLADLAGMTTMPSMGASVMALITELSDEQRRSAREAQQLQTKAIVDTMHDQAEEIRDNAITQLALGLASAGITIGTSLYTVSASSQALAASKAGALTAVQLQNRNQQIGAKSQGIGALASMTDQTSQYLGAVSSARTKELDAEIEKLRAYKESIDSLEDSLKELIRKAIDTQQEIAQNTNATREKILS